MKDRVHLPVVLLSMLFVLSAAARADVVKKSGTGVVPGTGGKEISFRASAMKTGPAAAHFWLDLKNENNQPVSLVACVMLDLDKSPVPHQKVVINKSTSGSSCTWSCSASGSASFNPSFYFGCKAHTLAANSGANVIDKAVTFSQTYQMSELGLVYWDLLQHCPVDASCDALLDQKQDVFLSPGAGTAGSFNVWVGGFFKLESGTKTSLNWAPGNWQTMSAEVDFPVLLRGVIEGLPGGTLVSLRVPTVDAAGRVAQAAAEFEVEPGEEDPRSGRPLEISLPYVLPGMARELPQGMRSRMSVLVPDLAEPLEAGRVARFTAEVFANGDNPIYAVGERMYSIQAVMVADPDPPEIAASEVQFRDRMLEVAIQATDDITMAVGASIVYRQGDGEEVVAPVDFDVPAEEGGVMFFRDQLGPLPPGEPIYYRLRVFDDVGNMVESEQQVIETRRRPSVSWREMLLIIVLLLLLLLILSRRRRARA